MTTLPDSRTSPKLQEPGEVFEASVHPVLEQVRLSLVAVVEAVTPPVRRVGELQRALDLDNHLSSSLFNLVHARDAYAAAMLLPGDRAMAKFFDRALSNGVAAALINDARHALDEYEEVVKLHADSREMFEALLSGFATESDSLERDIDLKNRRAMFRAASVLWRRQAKQLIGCLIVHPSATPGRADVVMITGRVGLCQTRPGPPLRLQGYFSRSPSSHRADLLESMQPLAPGDDTNPPGLLTQFCSQPLPTFRIARKNTDNVVYQLVPHSVGMQGESTFFFGNILRDHATIPELKPDSGISFTASFNDPVESAVLDVFMHDSLWNEQPPDVTCHAMFSDGTEDSHEYDHLPTREEAHFLGRGLKAARTPFLPRHTELLRFAFERVGWAAQEFQLFRCHVKYPLLNTRMRLTFKREE